MKQNGKVGKNGKMSVQVQFDPVLDKTFLNMLSNYQAAESRHRGPAIKMLAKEGMKMYIKEQEKKRGEK